jgi:O-acetyl-ADP-ribose deacetylase
VIRVSRGELAETVTEAVIRPVSADWTAVTPAMRRLELAAGDMPAEQCRRLGELPVGSAIITGAGALPAQFMIHIVVRSYDEPVTAAGIARGLGNAVRRLGEWGIRRVALPPLGTGAGNLDADESAAVMVPLLVDHARSSDAALEVDIVVDTDYELDVFTRHVIHASSHHR